MAASSLPTVTARPIVDRRLVMTKALRTAVDRSLLAGPFIPPRAALPQDFDASPLSDKESITVYRRPFRQLITICAEKTEFSLLDLCSHRRQADLVKARHVAYWLARSFTLLSYPAIGRRIGDRDHTTVLHGVKRVETIIDYYGVAFVDDPATMAWKLWSLDWSQVPR